MINTIESLLVRNLFEVFGEPDAEKRRAAVAALWAADGVFADPHGRYVGYAALNDAVSKLHARFPGFVFTSIGAPQAFYGVGRQAWGHGPVDEPPQISGLDVAIVQEGRIAALYAFVDTPRSLWEVAPKTLRPRKATVSEDSAGKSPACRAALRRFRSTDNVFSPTP